MSNMIKDYGINRGLVQRFSTSNFGEANAFWGFRKMFWTYLKKMHVPFADACCPDASEDPNIVPIGFDISTGETVYWDAASSSWLPITEWETTTTTTSTSTTSTTTEASTTTTTTV